MIKIHLISQKNLLSDIITLEMELSTSIAEGRPCYVCLALTIDPHPSSPQTLLPVVNDVSRVLHQRGSLVYLELDQTLIWQMEDVELKGDIMFPSCRSNP